MKKLMLVILMASIVLVSCGGKQEYKVVVDEKAKIAIINGEARIKLHYTCDREMLDNVAEVFRRALKKMGTYSQYKGSEIVVKIDDPVPNYYQALFQLGAGYFAQWQNQAVAYGIIQNIWEDMVFESRGKNDNVSVILYDERFNLLRIEDFREVFTRFGLDDSALKITPRYSIKYLLDRILYVSLQEIFEQDIKYFNPQEIDDVLFQIVILPEISEFARFLDKTYGKRKLVEIGVVKHERETWKSMFGEEINDMAETFIDGVTNINNEKYKNEAFTSEFDKLLKLYNSTTKSSLFKK